MDNKEMNDVQKSINEAFNYISSVKAAGDAVDAIAAARAYLRQAFADAGNYVRKDTKTKADGKKGNA